MLPPTYYDPTVLNVPVAAADQAGTDPSTNHAWKNGSFSFHDILDTLNPLQHIPLIDTLYRWVTGDEPGNVARIVGDGLYGGPVGLGVGLLSTAFKAETGKDPGETVIAALTGEDNAKVTLGAAQAQPAAGAQPAAATTAAAPATTAAPATRPAAAPAAATPLPMPAAAQAPAISAGPPHPFLPLFRSPPPVAPTTTSANPAEQAFIAQNAAYQRSLYAQRGVAAQPQTAPIPLQLTGAQMPFIPMRPTVAAAASATPAPAAASQTQAAAAATPPQSAPVDIPQRMMDALDKYARMQQQQNQLRGQQLDVAP